MEFESKSLQTRIQESLPDQAMKWSTFEGSEPEIPLLKLEVEGHTLIIGKGAENDPDLNSGVMVGFITYDDPRFPRGKRLKFRELPLVAQQMINPDTGEPLFNSDGNAFRMDLAKIEELAKGLIENPRQHTQTN